jgi:hypothetical protein
MAIRLTWLLAAAFATLVSAHAAQVLAQTRAAISPRSSPHPPMEMIS